MLYKYVKFKYNLLVFWFQVKFGQKFCPHELLAIGKADK